MHRISVIRHASSPEATREPFEIDVNERTGLIERLMYRRYAPSNHKQWVVVEVRYSDYRSVQGIAVPFRIEEYIRGHLAKTIELSSIEINPAVDEESFTARVAR